MRAVRVNNVDLSRSQMRPTREGRRMAFLRGSRSSFSVMRLMSSSSSSGIVVLVVDAGYTTAPAGGTRGPRRGISFECQKIPAGPAGGFELPTS